VAVMVAVSPALPPLVDIDGVVSFVMLSVLDEPESDEALKSSVVGAATLRSTVTDSPEDAEDVFPAVSLAFAVIEYAPAASVAVTHEKLPEPLVVQVDPVAVPVAEYSWTVELASAVPEIVSTVELVTLSVFEVPLSSAALRSRDVGALGLDASTVTEILAEAADAFPATSVTSAVTV